MSNPPDRQALIGKRIAVLDYGDARIGVAVCDEMHIVVSTRPAIENRQDTVWDELEKRLHDDRVDVVMVGVPWLEDGRITPIIERIGVFVEEFKKRIPISVYEIDESFSTKRAFEVMRSSGMRKQQRHAKGKKDEVAAAVLLRDFLEGTL
ncbi:MAG: Holliday junction resolvase RuvX [bacterium]|nr:Holliday junction resolvase RuvX [bacterium]